VTNELKDANGPSASPSAVLAELVDRLSEKMQAGEAINWEEMARQHPDHVKELRALLPAVGALGELSHSGQAGPSVIALSATASGIATGVLGDFRIVREVGRGGMGIVYEAEQVSLGRRVALKVLPFAATMDPRQLQRFHNESRAAASLHHENVVPVYAVGQERGTHFYAMQFIDGHTLADLIAELRRSAVPDTAVGSPGTGNAGFVLARAVPGGEATGPYTPPPSGPAAARCSSVSDRATTATPPVAGLSTARSAREPAFIRRAAEWGIQAAEALEHAHALGVVHRDVKPSNLLLDGQGRLWVTDFGLAQVQADSGLTMTGSLVGTLRYMSPEQALAKRGLTDHRTDVYSLGVTLYELLTLRPAFDGSDREELLRQIASEEPPPPRRLNRAVPRDLETVVLKAMAKEPAERYGTAQELADDLRRFLEDKPIKAKRPSAAQRARKWGRRHRAVVTTSALSLVLLMVALAVGVVLLWKERERTRAANQRLKENLQLALQALDEIHLQVTSARLHHYPERKQEDLELLKRTLAFYEGFAEQNSDDPEVRHEMAKAYGKVGEIRDLLGEHAAAEEAYDRSNALLEELAEQSPAEPVYRFDLGENLVRLGQLQMEKGRYSGAEKSYRRAMAIFQQLADDFPEELPYRKGLAQSHNNLGVLLRLFTGRVEEAEEEQRQAQRLREKLAADEADNDEYQSALADSYCIMADILRHTGRPLEAEKELRRALPIRQGLAKRFPRIPLYADRLVSTHKGLALSLHDSDQLREAERAYRRAIAIGEYLVKVVPTMPAYQENLASCYQDLGRLLREVGRRPEAEEAFTRSLKIKEKFPPQFAGDPVRQWDWATLQNERALAMGTAAHQLARVEKIHRQALKIDERLVKDHPEVAEFRYALAGDQNNLATVLLDRGRVRDAETNLHQAREIREKLVRDFPSVPDYRLTLGHTLANLASACRRRGDWREARRLLEEAIRHETAALERNSRHPTYRHSLRDRYQSLAEVLDHLGKKKEALEAVTEMRATFARLAEKSEGDLSCRRALDETHRHAGKTLEKLGRLADAEAAYREAIADLTKLSEADPTEPRHRYYLAHTQQALGLLLFDRGKHAASDEAFRAALELRKKLADDFPDDPWYLSDLADSRQSLGIVLTDRGQLAESEKVLLAGLEIRKRLVAKYVNELGHPSYRQGLGASHNALGSLYRQCGQPAKAEVSHREAVAILKKLSEDFPDNPEYRAELGDSYCNLGSMLDLLSQPVPAEAAFRKAVALHEPLVKEFKDNHEYRGRLAITYNNLAMLQEHMRKQTEAEKFFRKSLGLRKKLAEDLPGIPERRYELASNYFNLGLVLLNQQKVDAAEKEFHEAQAIFERLCNDHLGIPAYAVGLARTYTNLGHLETAAGRPLQGTVKWFGKAIEKVKPVVDKSPGLAEARQALRMAYIPRAEALNRLNRPSEALPDYDQAIALADGPLRDRLRSDRAVTLIALKEHARAREEADSLAPGKGLSIEVLLNLAIVYAQSAAAAREDAAHADRFAAQAVGMLRRAAGAGFDNVDGLKRFPGFAPLRSYKPFQELLKEMETKKDGQSP
jgi:serine/threonine protein kinase/tetratricopeptide (TPR) repeat protein